MTNHNSWHCRIAALRTHAAFIGLFFFLSITFLLLAAGAWTGNLAVNKAGGAFGILTALIAYYAGASQLFNKRDTFFSLPVGRVQRID